MLAVGCTLQCMGRESNPQRRSRAVYSRLISPMIAPMRKALEGVEPPQSQVRSLVLCPLS